jgi:putative tryptophan/tyrosine transport system substrate-binding protein
MRLVVRTVTLTVSFMLEVFGAESQPARKIPRIGYLVTAPLADPPSAERRAFLEGLRDLRYVGRQNLIVEYRSAKWNRDLLPDLAEELVALKVDVIVAVPGSADAARQATTTVPIVILGGADPVAAGLVASLAHPGGNITGTTVGLPEVAGKRLVLLKEAVPKMSRVTVLWNSATERGVQRDWQETQAAAVVLGVGLQSLEVRDPKDFPTAFSAIPRRRPDALIVVLSPLTSAYRPIIIDFAVKNRLPTMFGQRADVEAGGLMSYSPSVADSFRRAAGYVDKLLKGAKPGDLPIEQPTKFELVINLKTAKALRLTIPRSILGRADQVIE